MHYYTDDVDLEVKEQVTLEFDLGCRDYVTVRQDGPHLDIRSDVYPISVEPRSATHVRIRVMK